MKSKPGQPKSKPSKQQPQEQPPSLQEKLDQTRMDQQYWAQVAAGPNLSPQAAAWARDAAQSKKAAADLYEKAMNFQAASEDPNLQTLLGTNPSLQTPQPPSGQESPPS